jgi:YVTN family beta-propeller protein
MRKIHLALLSAITSLLLGFVLQTEAGVVWPDLIVHLHGSGHAYLVDPASDKVVADLPVGKGGTLGTTTPDGKKIYVGAAAEGQDTVTVIDLDKKAVVASIKTGNRPKHPQVSPDGKMVLVNHWGLDDGKLRVSFIDTATDKVVKEIPLEVSNANPSGPTSMHNGWSTDSRWAFTVDRVDNQFVIIDTNDWTVKSIDLPSKPHYTAPSPDGKEVWVVVEGVDRNNPPMAIVYAINGGAFKEIARLAMPLEGQTAIEGHHGNFTQDGKYFMLLNRGGGKNKTGNEVAVFDASTKKLVAALHTGSTGIGHAYNTPDGKYAVITNYGNNVISIVDTGSWKVVKDITIGKGRMGHIAFTKDGKWGYVSNNQDGVLYKVDMTKLELVGPVKTNGTKGAGQVLNVYTPVFEELPR